MDGGRGGGGGSRGGGGGGGGKKTAGAFFSPSGMLKRGWSGVTSPIVAIKDSVYAAATPRGSSMTPTGAGAGAGAGAGGTRMTLPRPAEYPSLFDVSAPSSTRSADGSTSYRQYGMGVISETEALRAPMSARASASSGGSRTGSRRTASSSSSRTGSRDRSFFHTDEGSASGSNGVFFPGADGADAMEEEEGRAYLAVCYHNLHSVLTNPKGSSWGGALLDAFYPGLEAPDIPMIPFPGLMDVSARDFEPYLRKFGNSAKMYEDNHVKPVSEQLSSSNVPSVAVADEDVAKCLEVVPNMFFRPDFDFTDPGTFEEVMTMRTSGSLQDELTTYLDRVEFTLLRQVSSRSDRFFEASADQEVMKQSITVACDQVATLRKTMDRLRNGLADKTLDIVSLHRRQKRVAELHELVTLIESVKSAEAAVEALVQIQDYTNALDLIDSSLTTLNDHLQGIHSLSALSDKFRGYRGFITSQISQRFIGMVTSSEWMYHEEDLAASPSQESSRIASRQRRSSSSVSAGKEEDAVSMKDVQRLVDVLFRLDALNDAVATYRDRLNEEVKVVVKTVVTETIAVSTAASKGGENGDGGSGNESKVSVQLRALTSDEFLQCVQMIFEHLLMILERAVVVQDVLAKSMQTKIRESEHHDDESGAVTSPTSSSSSSSTWTPADATTDEHQALGDWKQKTRCNAVIREIDEVIRKTCEFSQRSVANLFAVRKEVQAVYTMPQLRVLYDTTMAFAVSVEKLTGKTDYTLRGALFSQLKLFLEKYHQAQLAKLVSTLDHELWKNTEVAVARHKALEDLSSGRGVPLTLSSDREIAGETEVPFKAVSICGKSFRVVWSVLLMLEIVMNYMSCAANFPVLATDVLQRSIEIFRLFNSRTTQLVLGAGAMQVARLKSISARHLALASQSLDLSMTLIPHIKAALATHLTDRQKLLLDEFDRVLRDYAEHNEKIFSKFTSIVEDQMMRRFLENVAAEVDYDSSTLAVPSKPMLGIAQSTLKLHAVLHPVLSPVQMRDVMSRVFDMFSQKLPECFKAVRPKTSAGKNRVVDDMAAFVQSFRDVKEAEFNGDALLRHFRAAYTPS